jgi:hypothetical protein
MTNLQKQKHEISKRPVTDHALVQYLNRVEGYDIEAAKDRLRAYLEASQPTAINGIHRHPVSRHQVVVSKAGLVVTVLPADAPTHETT